MPRNLKTWAFIGISCAFLTSCGTYVPNLQEAWVDPKKSPIFVHELARSIHCEVRNAIVGIMQDDDLAAQVNHKPRSLSWLDTWGVQTSLQLTVEESSTLSPDVTLPHNMGDAIRFRNNSTVVTAESRALGLGGSLSSTSTRIDKLYSFYSVAEIRRDRMSCEKLLRDPTQSLLLQDDLRLREWISGVNIAKGLGDIKFNSAPKPPFDENAISHQIKFQVISSGNITPSWRLVTISANTSGPFFEAKRDRTHDLIITLGPTMPDPGDGRRRVLAPTAFNAANNADVATTIANAVRSGLRN